MKGIVLFILVIYTRGQPPPRLPLKPDRCNRPAEFMYRQCCVFPPFFTRDVAKSCGAFAVQTVTSEHNITGFTRQTLGHCAHWNCVLKKYGLLTEDQTLDDEKYYAHLDKWAELNPSFTKVIMNAKSFCKSLIRLHLPLPACDFFNIHGCIRNFVNVDCPVTIPTKECAELKEFFNECRDYYL